MWIKNIFSVKELKCHLFKFNLVEGLEKKANKKNILT